MNFKIEDLKKKSDQRNRSHTTICVNKELKAELNQIKDDLDLENLTELFKYFIIKERQKTIKF